MDVVASPLVTVILNVVANALVAKGILDSSSRVAFIQLINNGIAAIITLGVAIYSVYKMVDLQKHKISVGAGNFSQVNLPISTPASKGQSGLPADTSAQLETPIA